MMGAMRFGVVDGGVFRVDLRVQLVAMGDLRMVRRSLVFPGFIMLGRGMMMLGGLFVMVRRAAVMFSAFVSNRHDSCPP
jgi:hypothetical protein